MIWEALPLPIKVAAVGVFVGLPAALYYPLLFLRVQWYKTPIGRSMLLKGVAIASVLTVGICSLFWEERWVLWASAASDWLLCAAVWLQVLTFRQVQADGELERRIGKRRSSHEHANDS